MHTERMGFIFIFLFLFSSYSFFFFCIFVSKPIESYNNRLQMLNWWLFLTTLNAIQFLFVNIFFSIKRNTSSKRNAQNDYQNMVIPSTKMQYDDDNFFSNLERKCIPCKAPLKAFYHNVKLVVVNADQTIDLVMKTWHSFLIFVLRIALESN